MSRQDRGFEFPLANTRRSLDPATVDEFTTDTVDHRVVIATSLRMNWRLIRLFFDMDLHNRAEGHDFFVTLGGCVDAETPQRLRRDLMIDLALVTAVPELLLTGDGTEHPDFRCPIHRTEVVAPRKEERTLIVTEEVESTGFFVPPDAGISAFDLLEGIFDAILGEMAVHDFGVYLAMTVGVKAVMVPQSPIVDTDDTLFWEVERVGVPNRNVTNRLSPAVTDERLGFAVDVTIPLTRVVEVCRGADLLGRRVCSPLTHTYDAGAVTAAGSACIEEVLEDTRPGIMIDVSCYAN
jgi:hypothetical protein